MTLVVVPVSVQPLTGDGFAPFGEVLTPRGSLRPRMEAGAVSVERVQLPMGAVSTRVEELAMHWSYDQVFVEVAGRMALVVAPAAEEARADGEYSVDPEAVEAFLLEPGDVAMVRRGTWHMTVPLDDVTFVNVTRRDDDEDTTAGESARGYIAAVNLPAAAGAVVQLAVTS